VRADELAYKPDSVIWALLRQAALAVLCIHRSQRWFCWLMKAVAKSAADELRTDCGPDRVTHRAASGARLDAVRAADAVEAIAVEIFRQCGCSGQPVSMSVINRALEQLGAHRPSCRCGFCGEVVAKAQADQVYRTASIWQRSAAATRARMAL
jgi:hypothetical protein